MSGRTGGSSGAQRGALQRRAVGLEKAEGLIERGLALAEELVASESLATGDWTAISAGEQHSLALRSDGSLWGWGFNDGCLGLDSLGAVRLTPSRIGDASDWTTISAGGGYSLAVKTDGSLWAWGSNDFGQLGLERDETPYAPTRVGDCCDWAAISAGYSHSTGLKRDGSLWGWGLNHGFGAAFDRQFLQFCVGPKRVGDDIGWQAVACGWVAVRRDGTLWTADRSKRPCWYKGHRLEPERLPHWYELRRIGDEADWLRPACGEECCLALKQDGSLWAWGSNEFGQLGLADRMARVTPERVTEGCGWASVSLVSRHAVAIRSDGSLWAWGENEGGQLGLGDRVDRDRPCRVGADNDWSSVSAGGLHTLALKRDGTMWSWGWQGNYRDLVRVGPPRLHRMQPPLADCILSPQLVPVVGQISRVESGAGSSQAQAGALSPGGL